MKKQFIIAGLCLTGLLATGCGHSQEATVTNLANQIDLLNNTISSISYKTEELPLPSSLTKNQAKNYSGIYQSAKNVMSKQNKYKTAITTKTGMIKNKLGSKDLNLTKQSSKALVDLTSALSKNTKNLDQTKAEMSKSLKEIKRTIEDNSSSTSQVSAKLNRLSNCMDSQNCYYKNLLNTLLNIERILGIDDSSFDYNSLNESTPNTKSSDIIQIDSTEKNLNNDLDAEEDFSKELQSLLYQYLLNNLTNNQSSSNNCNTPYCPNCNNNQELTYCPNGNCDTYTNNNTSQNQACPNLTNTNQTSNNLRGNNPNSIYKGYYGRFTQLPLTNPGRNTDTFRPWTTNIDTYRITGNPQGYNNEIINQTVTPVNKILEEEKQSTQEKDTKETQNTSLEDSSILRTSTLLNDQKFGGKAYKLRTIDVNITSKPKGHTKAFACTLDTNKKIEELLKRDLKDSFNNFDNYIYLR